VFFGELVDGFVTAGLVGSTRGEMERFFVSKLGKPDFCLELGDQTYISRQGDRVFVYAAIIG